jgi:hypothetical protein
MISGLVSFRYFRAAGLAVAILLSTAIAQAQDPIPIDFLADQPTLEVIGQVTNFATTPPTSQQIGRVTWIRGIGFVSNVTFFTQATVINANVVGGIRSVIRTGVTTFYLVSSPPDFSNPDSFKSDHPILVSTLRQQVVVNDTNPSFSVVNVNNTTSVAPFAINGTSFVLNPARRSFRTHLSGAVNATPPPTGWFGGYIVGIRH